MSAEMFNEQQRNARLSEQQSLTDTLAAEGLNQLFFTILTNMENDPRYEGLPPHFLKDMLARSMTAGVKLLDPQTIDQLEPLEDAVDLK